MTSIGQLKLKALWPPLTNTLRWLALAAIIALAAGLRLANLQALGYGNHYYTAAVKSMLLSWHNFFFVAAEPGGAVSVDKPPLGLWLQALSAYFLGVNGFAVLLPEILAGLLSVGVIYHLVRRSFGPAAGLLAALTLAITPIVVATDRNNTIDSLLIFTLLLAAWAFIKATESGRLRYLWLGAVLVGLGFNIKMLQAYLPLPAFYALYFFGTNSGVWRKVVNLSLATLLLLVVSLSWAVMVDLTPANQRPYVGSSDNNSVLNLALGYNGLERLTSRGMGPGGGPPKPTQPSETNGSFAPPGQNNPIPPAPLGNSPASRPGSPLGGGPGTGQAGPLRLFTTPLSKEMSWLLPFGVFSAVLLAFCARWRWPLALQHQALVLWGGWLLIGAGFLSLTQHFHEYYLSMLGPPLAALVGIGVITLWRLGQQRPWLAVNLLLAAAALTLGFQLLTATSFVSGAEWLVGVMALFVISVGILIVSASRQLRRGMMAGFACITAALLLIPGVWSGLTVLNGSANASQPSAYSGRAAGPQPASKPDDGRATGAGTMRPASNDNQAAGVTRSSGLRVNQTLLDYLEPRTQYITYLMAVPSSMQGADYVLATGRPVLYIGGFKGSDQVVTGNDLARLVAEGKLRYIYWGGSGGGPGGKPGGQADIFTWVTAHCQPVKEFETLDELPGAGPTADGSPASNRAERSSLYNCSG
jgi:4-amino-4-deoxy-L-arabinose transferase-like glycosyltransferase